MSAPRDGAWQDRAVFQYAPRWDVGARMMGAHDGARQLPWHPHGRRLGRGGWRRGGVQPAGACRRPVPGFRRAAPDGVGWSSWVTPWRTGGMLPVTQCRSSGVGPLVLSPAGCRLAGWRRSLARCRQKPLGAADDVLPQCPLRGYGGEDVDGDGSDRRDDLVDLGGRLRWPRPRPRAPPPGLTGFAGLYFRRGRSACRISLFDSAVSSKP